MADDNDIKELAKLIYANSYHIIIGADFYKEKARLLTIASFEAAKIFYDYTNDYGNPK